MVPSEVRVDLTSEAPRRLSEYGFFTHLGSPLVPNEGVVPYDLNTPLFSDYTTKYRFIRLPPGTSATYAEEGPIDLPVGSVVIKTFSYLNDIRDPSKGERLLETRLLVRAGEGYEPRIYVWNKDQDDADLDQAGSVVETSWTHYDGETRTNRYIIPNANQCKGCHENSGVTDLIGPKARNLNRGYLYSEGLENQIAHLERIGYLAGGPSTDARPTLPVWDDPSSGSVEDRARAWLDVQCAHCHNPKGPARTSALDLRYEQRDPKSFGICKPPVAAGRGSGGFHFDIVPGKPDESILVFRMESTDPGVRMPELPIMLVHAEGVALVRDWIATLDGSCS